MVEIDVVAQQTKYQAEYDTYVKQLSQLDMQRAQLIQAIQERRGILVFLASLDQHKLGK